MKTIKAVKANDGSVMAWLADGSSIFWPAHLTIKPDYRFRMVTINCHRYRLEWVR